VVKTALLLLVYRFQRVFIQNAVSPFV